MSWIHVIRPVLGPGLCQTGLGLDRLSKTFPPPFLSKASNKTSHPIAKPTVQRGRLRSTRRSSALAGGEPPTFRKPLPVQGNLQRQVCKDFLATIGTSIIGVGATGVALVTGVTGWVWALPGAGPFSQAVVVAVSNDVTVAGQNLERKGGSGDCLGPDHFRKELWWQCVMTSLSQLKILEFSALLGQFLCLLASLSQSKIVRAKSPKNMFF